MDNEQARRVLESVGLKAEDLLPRIGGVKIRADYVEITWLPMSIHLSSGEVLPSLPSQRRAAAQRMRTKPLDRPVTDEEWRRASEQVVEWPALR